MSSGVQQRAIDWKVVGNTVSIAHVNADQLLGLRASNMQALPLDLATMPTVECCWAVRNPMRPSIDEGSCGSFRGEVSGLRRGRSQGLRHSLMQVGVLSGLPTAAGGGL